jgi:hypothetical protein
LYVEDVARAFDIILHHGVVGEVYNIGGRNEISNIDVARAILQLMGLAGDAAAAAACGAAGAEQRHIKYVPDRPFNDLAYPLDSSRLAALGWREEVSWDEGLKRTVEWYLTHSANFWPEVERALVAHPRRGYTRREVLEGKPDDGYDFVHGGYEYDSDHGRPSALAAPLTAGGSVVGGTRSGDHGAAASAGASAAAAAAASGSAAGAGSL